MKYWRITLNWLFILALLAVIVPVNAQQPTQPEVDVKLIDKKVQVQLYELLAMDCGVKGGIDRFRVALDKLDVDVSPVFIRILQDGSAPEEVLRLIRDRAKTNFKTRQAWLKKEGAELFDKQTMERLSAVSLDDYTAGSIRRTNIRYQINAMMGLEHIGKSNAIEIIMKAAEQESELEIIAKQAIQSIMLRETTK